MSEDACSPAALAVMGHNGPNHPDPAGCPLCRRGVSDWTDTAPAVSLSTGDLPPLMSPSCEIGIVPAVPRGSIRAGRKIGAPAGSGRAASLLGRWRI